MSGSKKPFSTFRLLSFDIYGTLIEWEKGIIDALSPIRARLPDSSPLKTDDLALASLFVKHELRLQSTNPGRTYDKILRDAYISVATELLPPPSSSSPENKESVPNAETLQSEGVALAESIAIWPPFPDTIDAMRKLKRLGFILVPVSNVDRDSFGKTLAGPLAGLSSRLSGSAPFFDAVYTAQDIGSYKPDLRNFEYLISHAESQFGVQKHQILHVAQSLTHDHVPAKQIGLESVWIARGKDGVSGIGGDVEALEGRTAFAWRFKDLGEFADAVEAELQK
ncbi:hypothetical protein UA08_04596 [Talaromyces atroroseus]|uniref:Haloacid dehalogenase, type II n=1 Tax=Talaromyces atroroseus TaxID=1441469 RepID=A0A225B2E3_TALAT|nr:hypothetical protein UA08_04596 [Talaromyces atroroseus]OKL60017.1 hypothetical protein UA08_04596 [Talaromyces atroroseus]